MNRIYILCVDDEAEGLEAIERDLRSFDDHFPVETAQSAKEARQWCRELEAQGDRVGLVLTDHLMPEETGVDLLVSLDQIPTAAQARKVLLTGQAGQEDTIQALNQGGLHYYIAKPWSGEALQEVVRDQLTSFVLDATDDPMAYMAILDGAKIAEALHRKGGLSDH